MLAGHHENPVFIYILEILSACLICYFLYLSFPQYQLIWAMIYIPVVISPIREKSRLLVFSRIKANFLGAAIGFIILLVFKAAFLSFCIAAIATILLCHALKIIATARSALLTLVSVAIPQHIEPLHVVAVERIIFVTCGCLIALSVILFFDRLVILFSQPERNAAIKDE
jgi:uncharacterized membrane protein YgaE (UPF0421/DUF939 family)